jgi:VWFA-related protein
VSVLDRDGKYVPNLRQGDFRLWEDNVEQQIAYFASVDAPFTVALVLDTSGSMEQKWDEIQEAAINFTRQLRPEDRVMVISFDDTVRVLAEPTNDRYILRRAIRQARGGEGTRLYDAVDLVIHRYLANVKGRKAVVLFTDGVDTTSRWATYDTTTHAAEEADVLIYPVEYDTYEDAQQIAGGWPSLPIIVLGFPFPGSPTHPAGTRRIDYDVGDNYLHDLARATGANFYAADDPQKLEVAFHSIAEELGRQYSLGYYPKRKPEQGERRSVKVRVNRPNLAVRARESYAF